MVTGEQALTALESTRVVIYLNMLTEEHDNQKISGYLRGFSSNWVVLQEMGAREALEPEFTLVNQSAIQILRKESLEDEHTPE